jgi:hypothetical protein
MPPTWVVRVCRMAFILTPIALFVPFEWWVKLAALGSAVLAYRLLPGAHDVLIGATTDKRSRSGSTGRPRAGRVT